jgi:hypothetical protein
MSDLTLNPNGYGVDVDIKIVKFIDQSGRISFLIGEEGVRYGLIPGSGKFPSIMFRGFKAQGGFGYVDVDKESPVREDLLLQWERTQNIPKALERWVLFFLGDEVSK